MPCSRSHRIFSWNNYNISYISSTTYFKRGRRRLVTRANYDKFSVFFSISIKLVSVDLNCWLTHRGLVTPYQDVFVPGPFLRILDSTRCQRTPLCHILLLNLDILQGSFRLCNWLSLRRLVSWINHLPPACWSTFRKSNSKQQLGCRFDIMDYESYLFVFWHMQLYMSWYIISFFGFTLLNILHFFKYSCTNIFL